MNKKQFYPITCKRKPFENMICRCVYSVIILLKYFVSIEISIIPIFIYASQLTRQKVYFSHNNGKCRANDAIGMLKLYSYISYQLGSFIASKVNKHIVSTANFRNTVFSCSLFLSICFELMDFR